MQFEINRYDKAAWAARAVQRCREMIAIYRKTGATLEASIIELETLLNDPMAHIKRFEELVTYLGWYHPRYNQYCTHCKKEAESTVTFDSNDYSGAPAEVCRDCLSKALKQLDEQHVG
jgi:hypothetical protein